MLATRFSLLFVLVMVIGVLVVLGAVIGLVLWLALRKKSSSPGFPVQQPPGGRM